MRRARGGKACGLKVHQSQFGSDQGHWSCRRVLFKSLKIFLSKVLVRGHMRVLLLLLGVEAWRRKSTRCCLFDSHKLQGQSEWCPDYPMQKSLPADPTTQNFAVNWPRSPFHRKSYYPHPLPRTRPLQWVGRKPIVPPVSADTGPAKPGPLRDGIARMGVLAECRARHLCPGRISFAHAAVSDSTYGRGDK